jgi:hypothetical protein
MAETQIESKLQVLFDLIESNDYNTFIEQFIDDYELKYLCEQFQHFDSVWSSPYKESQTPYQRACLLMAEQIW